MSRYLSPALVLSLLWTLMCCFSSTAEAATNLAAGDGHTVALKSDGTVWAWGDNRKGQLGDGTTTNRATPVQVHGLNGVTAVAAGYWHSVALKGDGTVWAWGLNDAGQLGDGTAIDRISPVQVPGLRGIIALDAGGWHTVVLKGDGTIWAWGNNYHGQLGDGTTTDRAIPIQVRNLNAVVAIAAGFGHSVALKSDGTVWAWGDNIFGELGDGTVGQVGGPSADRTTPVQTRGMSGGVALDAGYSHTVALKGDGTAWAWGDNYHGQLGDGTSLNKRITPVQVSGLSGGVALAAGWSFTVALKRDGTVWTWGYPYAAGSAEHTTPVAVNGLNGMIAIAAGSNHTMALKGDGTIWGWGYNDAGKLGDGTKVNRATPVQVLGAEGNGYLNLLQASPPPSGGIVMALEEPAAGSTYSGVANVRGWAVAPQGMSKVELYVDDQFVGQIPLGGRRADVGDAYPGYPESAQSGFAMAYNYSNLTAGAHTFTARAIDASGGARDARVTANVVRFENSFMADPAAVNLDQATLSRGGNAITVQNLLADGKPYTVQLSWRPAAQGFAFSQIAPVDVPPTSLIGALENVNLQIWSGWACEPGNPSTSLKVELYLNSNRVATAQASLLRSDISSQCGNPNHGFSWNPAGSGLTIKSGDRASAYAIHSTGSEKTLIGSKICNIVCPNPNDITSCKLTGNWNLHSCGER